MRAFSLTRSGLYRYGFRALVFICILILLRSYLSCSPYVCRSLLRPSTMGLGPHFRSSLAADTCSEGQATQNDSESRGSVAVVAATLEADDLSWIRDNFPEWKLYRYIMDNQSMNKTIPKRKGSESMAYLTYIIDNYNDLPELMIFSHGTRYQWHNDDPMYDGVGVLQNLQLSSVSLQGYVNLRCTWELGCPSTIRPHRLLSTVEAFFEPNNDRANMEASFSRAFGELFNEEAPSEIGSPCCAQFAVSREQVRKRSECEYRVFREWLLRTPLPDSVSGRIMEYVWHIIMGMPALHCPDAKECFCESFGHCDLTCETEGSCKGRYWQPPRYTIPKKWPEIGPGIRGLPDWGWWENA